MHILPLSKYNRAISAYEKASIKFPLINAVLWQIQSGTIYTNNSENPISFFVFNKFGFAQQFGEYNTDFENELINYIYQPSDFPIKYLLWYNPDLNWINITKKSFLSDKFKYRERVRFLIDKCELLEAESEKNNDLNFKLIKSNAHLELASDFNLDLCSRFWDSCQEFLENGIGILAFKNNQVAAICYSAALSNREAEIDVLTLPEFRGSGIGKQITIEFIKECLKQSVRPTWDCFIENRASYKLALSCGFKEVDKYSFLSLYREFK